MHRLLTDRQLREKLGDTRPADEIRVGLGSCCVAQGSGKVRDRVEQVLGESGAAATITMPLVRFDNPAERGWRSGARTRQSWADSTR